MQVQRTFPEPQPISDAQRPPIPLHNVDSSQVKAVGYDEVSRTLAVTFTRGTGAIYHYPNVDKTTHEAFVNAESIGVFFGKFIKHLPFVKYPCEGEAPPRYRPRPIEPRHGA